MKKRCFFFCMTIAMSLLMLTGCQVTPESAWKHFEALPFQGYDLIASAMRESHTDDCHSVMIEVVYYTSLSFDDVLRETERELVTNDWSKVGEDFTANTPVQYASYQFSNQAYITIYPQVKPISRLWPESGEYVDLQSLSLDPVIDNRNPDDGYFLIEFHYHPYTPNNCGG